MSLGGDFETGGCCLTSVSVGPMLGPNGRPVLVTGNPLPTDVNAMTNELLWWTPDGSHVVSDGVGVVPLPFADDTFFTPQGTGGGNGGGFYQTAIFTGFFSLGSSTNLSFNLAADDDLFVFLDGALINQDIDGVHQIQSTSFMQNVGAGDHQLKFFYADRHTGAAQVHISVLGVDLRDSPVPEPATWAMMITGFMGVGVMLRRRRAGPAIA